MAEKWRISIDTGGTFTDCIAYSPAGELKRLKVLSSSILRIAIKEFTGPSSCSVHFPFPIHNDFLQGFSLRIGKSDYKITRIDPSSGEVFLSNIIVKEAYTAEITSCEEVPVFAARLLTETGLLMNFPEIELKLGSTRGTNALLERKGARTAFIATKGFKDLLLIGSQQRQNLFSLRIQREKPLYQFVYEINERVTSDGSILTPLLIQQMDELVNWLKKNDVESVAIALMNSYTNPSHEIMIEELLGKSGFRFISSSHKLSPYIKMLPRAETSVVNAYLDPVINTYIGKIQEGIGSADFSVMSSAGGLLNSASYKPKDSLLSGPAGGVIGALQKAKQSATDKIITFDMGGTSTDVSLCNGRPEYSAECKIGRFSISSPSISIETIAAGGGSICEFDGFRLIVGPHSAGASPGPACYGAGGPLSITDVNLLLGRLDQENFSIPIQKSKAEERLSELVLKTKKKKGEHLSPEHLLKALLQIANEKMAEAIRKVSVRQGHDPRDYSLLCFGGAGGQHACALASMLGIKKIIVPYDAGLLSAYGIGNAMPEKVTEKLVLKDLADISSSLPEMISQLSHDTLSQLRTQKVSHAKITGQYLFLRLKGQESTLEIEYTPGIDIRKTFIAKYKKIYGHWVAGRKIEVESVRIIAAEESEKSDTKKQKPGKYKPRPLKHKKIFVDDTWITCEVYRWEDLSPGASVKGPGLLISDNSTLFIESNWKGTLDENQNFIFRKRVKTTFANAVTTHLEEAELELFTNRFTSIAQQMGALLQRTSFSVNVKERLDFSCALLDVKGNLVVNAPHIPVHLGSLGVCVRELMEKIEMKNGDVIITNHPAYGGSHLPDITLVKPVYYKNTLIGFAANRAHHAEIGGKKPGSMPADAKTLAEEGVVIHPTYLMRRGKAQWNDVEKILLSGPYPTRSLHENLADLNGALASVTMGEQLLISLAATYGSKEVASYMQKLKEQANTLLTKKLASLKGKTLHATEHLDDGTVLKTSIKHSGKKLVIDFSNSSQTHPGNLNATKAIVQSVVLYVLRILVDEPIPLNEGLLQSVKLILPPGEILNPVFHKDHSKSPAVVGGNTEVSQRLTDTLLKAFKLAACSQGTMNNFLFGNEKFGYYETICGGTGAGPGYSGADAVHQHMTNTRITDPEILEFRYPVRLERFEIRKGSGGKGRWNGGNGVIREFYFNDRLEINILSQHRIETPYGMKGGKPGRKGDQFVIRAGGKPEKLKGVEGTSVKPGDRIVILTPGGGGWGR